MSDWDFINKGRVREGAFGSDDSFGCNGAFCLWIDGQRVKIIASDGMGWKHISVSLQDNPKATPRWDLMCKVKDLFFEPEEIAIQIHPAKSEYINNHPGCLHLFRCTDGREQPLPPIWMIGLKELNPA